MSINQYPAVKILKVGTIRLEASEMASILTLQIKSELGIGGGSTVTLIDGEKFYFGQSVTPSIFIE